MSEQPITDAVRQADAREGLYQWLLWCAGRKVGRAIYAMVADDPSDDDVLIGLMDSVMLADEVVRSHNIMLAQAQRRGASPLNQHDRPAGGHGIGAGHTKQRTEAEQRAVELVGIVSTLTSALQMIEQGYVFRGSERFVIGAEQMQIIARAALEGGQGSTAPQNHEDGDDA